MSLFYSPPLPYPLSMTDITSRSQYTCLPHPEFSWQCHRQPPTSQLAWTPKETRICHPCRRKRLLPSCGAGWAQCGHGWV